MKKFLAVLLSVLVFLPILTTSSFALHSFSVPENACVCGFIYKVNGKAFFSSYEAIDELIETGKTTVYLPMECEGEDVVIRYLLPYREYEGGYAYCITDAVVPGSSFCEIIPKGWNDVCRYTIYFVCSEEAEYDYERQIGTSDYVDYAGYLISLKRAVFLSQDEIDASFNEEVIYIKDEALEELSFLDVDEFYFAIGGNNVGGGFDGVEIIYFYEDGDGTRHEIYINDFKKVRITEKNFIYMMQRFIDEIFLKELEDFFFRLVNLLMSKYLIKN